MSSATSGSKAGEHPLRIVPRGWGKSCEALWKANEQLSSLWSLVWSTYSIYFRSLFTVRTHAHVHVLFVVPKNRHFPVRSRKLRQASRLRKERYRIASFPLHNSLQMLQ